MKKSAQTLLRGFGSVTRVSEASLEDSLHLPANKPETGFTITFTAMKTRYKLNTMTNEPGRKYPRDTTVLCTGKMLH